jgi:dihydroorotase
MDRIEMPLADDLHLHLRQDAMLRSVAPLVRAGGVGRCVVMPNTKPPVCTVADALRYQAELQAVSPEVEFLMTLYLQPELTPTEIEKAANNGVFGIKCYPRGVTTGSESGVEDLGVYREIFEVMAANGLPLLIHGEAPSNSALDICVMNAEEKFLPELMKLQRDFPELRIVLEHVTTAAAVECVLGLGENVAATVTAHHLELTIDDWAGSNHNFCKPVAKYPHDREAVRRVVCEGNPRFFLGSDSAPHPRHSKEGASGAAGIFTTPLLLPYLADCFDRLGCLERLRDFSSTFGRQFHGLPALSETITLVKEPQVVPDIYGEVVPFKAGQTLQWRLA